MHRSLGPAAAVFLMLSVFVPTRALGQNTVELCCADLEERISALETTTARTGNRNVTIRLSGQVDTMVLIWDDGTERDAYVVDNTESSTRFLFSGTSRIGADWSTSFLFEIEVEGARSTSVNQISDGAPNENADGSIDGRRMALSLGSKNFGRLWIGRYSPATDNLITWGNKAANNPVANATPNRGEGFFLRLAQGTGGCTGTGCLINQTWRQFMSSQDTRRGNVIRYDTPSLAGFVISAAWGEDDLTDVALRWKKTFNAVDAYFGIGYLRDTDEDEDTDMVACPGAGGGGTFCRQRRFDLERMMGSFGLKHGPSGLFLVGAAARDHHGSPSGPTGLFTGATRQDRGTMAYLQGGKARRFTSLGPTTFYAERQIFQDFSKHRTIAYGTGGQSEVISSQTDVWGVGVFQNIDAANMQLFAGFRHGSADIDVLQTANGPQTDVPVQDFWTLSIGGKLKF